MTKVGPSSFHKMEETQRTKQEALLSLKIEKLNALVKRIDKSQSIAKKGDYTLIKKTLLDQLISQMEKLL